MLLDKLYNAFVVICIMALQFFVMLWVLIAFSIQFAVPFNLMFLIFDVVSFVLAFVVPLGCCRNKWCRKMIIRENVIFGNIVLMILAIIINNFMYWDLVKEVLKGMAGYK